MPQGYIIYISNYGTQNIYLPKLDRKMSIKEAAQLQSMQNLKKAMERIKIFCDKI